jgi:hypothetical protein
MTSSPLFQSAGVANPVLDDVRERIAKIEGGAV